MLRMSRAPSVATACNPRRTDANLKSGQGDTVPSIYRESTSSFLDADAHPWSLVAYDEVDFAMKQTLNILMIFSLQNRRIIATSDAMTYHRMF